ncbi:MAG: nucleotidyltransferase [Porphyromonas sp.]
MVQPTLLVLAAGMGSRYGSLKQLDGLGPSGETIMDYSIYDAIRAGFGKVVFIIRRSFEQDFREKILSKYEGRIPVDVVFQDMDNLPAGFSVPEGREKPWGTNHAVMMAKDVIKEPFAVINADDFYGRSGFAVIADKLRQLAGGHDKYCMVGYRVGNTLSESGSVARGVCEVDTNNFLTGVVERTAIQRNAEGKIAFTDENGKEQILGENTPVSMNMWGFTPDYFVHSDEYFAAFLRANEGNLKAEYFIPLVVNQLVQENKATCEVLDTPDQWFGVTYAADRPDVVAKINALVAAGEYPQKLFS